MLAFHAGNTQNKRNPEGNDRDKIQSVEGVPQKRPPGKMETLLFFQGLRLPLTMHDCEGSGERRLKNFWAWSPDRLLALRLEDGSILLRNPLTNSLLAIYWRIFWSVYHEPGNNDPDDDLDCENHEQAEECPVNSSLAPPVWTLISIGEHVGCRFYG
jgi:hypothetical protein